METSLKHINPINRSTCNLKILMTTTFGYSQSPRTLKVRNSMLDSHSFIVIAELKYIFVKNFFDINHSCSMPTLCANAPRKAGS